jgi:hypothetical protein
MGGEADRLLGGSCSGILGFSAAIPCITIASEPMSSTKIVESFWKVSRIR